MADTVRTEVKGLDNLKRTMAGAERDLKTMPEAHAQASGIIATAARSRAPRVSGRLAASVRPAVTPTSGGVEVGTEYGGVILFGWGARNIRANPFVTEAAAAVQPLVTQAYVRNVDKSLSKVKGI